MVDFRCWQKMARWVEFFSSFSVDGLVKGGLLCCAVLCFDDGVDGCNSWEFSFLLLKRVFDTGTRGLDMCL